MRSSRPTRARRISTAWAGLMPRISRPSSRPGARGPIGSGPGKGRGAGLPPHAQGGAHELRGPRQVAEHLEEDERRRVRALEHGLPEEASEDVQGLAEQEL